MPNAKITIRNINGPALRESTHDGRRFVGGTIGQSYAIDVENLTHGRILAVITVDGRNVLDASAGDHGGQGYVIGGGSRFSCEGWRTSSSAVAEFKLTSANASYAALTLGDASNIGVIGVAVFTEERYRQPSHDWLGPQAKVASRGSQMRSAGTGFGEERQSHVTTTSFRRAGEPEIHVIHYDTIEAFVDAGIMMLTTQPSSSSGLRLPEPFPASSSAFCPRPTEVSR